MHIANGHRARSQYSSGKMERMRVTKRTSEMSKNLNLQREMHNSKLNYIFQINLIWITFLWIVCVASAAVAALSIFTENFEITSSSFSLAAHTRRAPCTTCSSLHRWRCNFRCVNDTNGKTNKPRNILISRTFHNGISPETVVLLIFILFCWSARVYLSRSEWKIL